MSDELKIGTVINNRYTLEKQIATGRTSLIFKSGHGRRTNAVIKILNPEKGVSSLAFKQFADEAAATKAMAHANIVSMFDEGFAESGLPYIFMEFCEGQTLAEVLQTRGTLEIAYASRIIWPICEALEHISKNNYVFGGLNPSDIIIGPENTVKLIDFGEARILSSTEIPPLVHGRAHYMTPEQCQRLQIDCRADVYSLGCVIHECLTGSPPIRGDNFLEIIAGHISQPVLEVAAKDPDLFIPDEIGTVILKALKKDPADRYQSVSEMKASLKNAFRQTVPDVPQDDGSAKKNKKWFGWFAR